MHWGYVLLARETSGNMNASPGAYGFPKEVWSLHRQTSASQGSSCILCGLRVGGWGKLLSQTLHCIQHQGGTPGSLHAGNAPGLWLVLPSSSQGPIRWAAGRAPHMPGFRGGVGEGSSILSLCVVNFPSLSSLQPHFSFCLLTMKTGRSQKLCVLSEGDVF